MNEIALVKKLHPEWYKKMKDDIEEELLETYESDTVRMQRMRAMGKGNEASEGFQKLLNQIQEGILAGKPLTDLKENDVDDEALEDVIYCLGASGMSAMIDAIVRGVKSAELEEQLKTAATARHAMLLVNEEVLA